MELYFTLSGEVTCFYLALKHGNEPNLPQSILMSNVIYVKAQAFSMTSHSPYAGTVSSLVYTLPETQANMVQVT